MFAKLKKKIAEEAATAPRSSSRMARSASKESITSGGADSGDDFASDGSSSRDDLSSQVLRRNDQIRRLEARLSDYAEQLRVLQRTKEKVEFALEKHQDSSMRKLQDQQESHQASRAKMADDLTLALEKKEQEWMEKMELVEQEKQVLKGRVDDLMKESLTLFQKRDDRDELDTFQQQELAKLKHMLLRKEEKLSQQEKELQEKEVLLQEKEVLVQRSRRSLSEAQGHLRLLHQEQQEISHLNTELEVEREELLVSRDQAQHRNQELELRNQELQALLQQVSEDFHKSQAMLCALERSLSSLQTTHNSLKLQHHKAEVVEEDHASTLSELQLKLLALETRLQKDFSLDQHLQELMEEKREVEQRLEKVREDLLETRTSHADTISSLEAQVSTASGTVGELQTLLRHKEDSSKAYRDRTEAQISSLEQQVLQDGLTMQRAEQDNTEQQIHVSSLKAAWASEKASLDQQVALERQLREDTTDRLEQEKAAIQSESQTQLDALHLRMREVEEEKSRVEEDNRRVEEELGQAASLLQSRTEELASTRVELSSRHHVSVEVALALEASRKQREELQAQVAGLLSSHDAVQQEVAALSTQLTQREEQIATLHNELQASRAGVVQLEARLEAQRAEAQQQEAGLREDALSQSQLLDTCQSRVSFLEVEALTEQLPPPGPCAPPSGHNGVGAEDQGHHLHNTTRDLEQQLADKNRTVRQLQQRLAELKRTFQKELKLKPDSDGPGRGERAADDPLATSSCPAPPPGPAPSPGLATPRPPTSTCTVTNTSDLNDQREINFEYLKHVVLKFMSCREAEAFHLIRAVSVLLNFTREEEDMLKQTLEYKMSWFGSKPSPKGSIRPSISGTSPAHWM